MKNSELSKFDLPVPSISNLQYYIKSLNLIINFNSSDNIPEKNATNQNDLNNEKQVDSTKELKTKVNENQNPEIHSGLENIFEIIKNHQLRIMLLENEKNIKMSQMNKKLPYIPEEDNKKEKTLNDFGTSSELKHLPFFSMKEINSRQIKFEFLHILNIDRNVYKNQKNDFLKIEQTKNCQIIFSSKNISEQYNNSNNLKSFESNSYKDIVDLLKNSYEYLQNELSKFSKKKQIVTSMISKRKKAIESGDKLKFLVDLFSELFPSKKVLEITNSNIENYYNLGNEIIEKKHFKYIEYDQSEKSVKKLLKRLKSVISHTEEQ